MSHDGLISAIGCMYTYFYQYHSNVFLKGIPKQADYFSLRLIVVLDMVRLLVHIDLCKCKLVFFVCNKKMNGNINIIGICQCFVLLKR